MNIDWEDMAFKTVLVILLPVFICGVLFVAVVPFIIACDYWFNPHQTITLESKDWHCTSTYEERHFNGKMWTTRTECAEYQKKESL